MATLNLRLDCSFLRFKTLRDQIPNSKHFARDMKILFTSILPVLSQVLLPIKNKMKKLRPAVLNENFQMLTLSLNMKLTRILTFEKRHF